MAAHHYLGALPKIGHTFWYVATWQGQWRALPSFSAAAWKCAARGAHYVFTVKDNQPILHADLRLFFEEGRGQPDFREPPTLAHGRIEPRAIWTTAGLNDYLDFPGVGQAFLIERHAVEKTTGKTTIETVYGVTSHTRDTVSATIQRLARKLRLVFDDLRITENSRRPPIRLAPVG